jgi:hypothetical protein
VKVFLDHAKETDNYFNALLGSLKKPNRRKNPLVNNFINFIEHGKRSNLSHKERLAGSQRQMVDSFNSTSKSVQRFAGRMAFNLGGAIAISLLALIFIPNADFHKSWSLLISAISLMLASTYSFHRFWSDMHQLTVIVDSQYLIMTDLKSKIEDEEKESKG